MTAYLNDWPSGAITERNTPTMQNACRKMLDTMRVNHMNVIYYHVRAMCDAMYNSAYEPWSSYVSGTRGVAPAFDPFEYLVEEAHKRQLDTCLAGDTAIIPILIGNDADAFDLSVALGRKGVFVPPAVYPAVPRNSARLRFCVISEHKPEQIEQALDILEATAREFGIELPRRNYDKAE